MAILKYWRMVLARSVSQRTYATYVRSDLLYFLYCTWLPRFTRISLVRWSLVYIVEVRGADSSSMFIVVFCKRREEKNRDSRRIVKRLQERIFAFSVPIPFLVELKEWGWNRHQNSIGENFREIKLRQGRIIHPFEDVSVLKRMLKLRSYLSIGPQVFHLNVNAKKFTWGKCDFDKYNYSCIRNCELNAKFSIQMQIRYSNYRDLYEIFYMK